jgi:hypothetical protein
VLGEIYARLNGDGTEKVTVLSSMLSSEKVAHLSLGKLPKRSLRALIMAGNILTLSEGNFITVLGLLESKFMIVEPLHDPEVPPLGSVGEKNGQTA